MEGPVALIARTFSKGPHKRRHGEIAPEAGKGPCTPGRALMGSVESPLPGGPPWCFLMRPHHILMTIHSATKQLLIV